MTTCGHTLNCCIAVFSKVAAGMDVSSTDLCTFAGISRHFQMRSFRRKLPVPLSFEAWPCSCLRFQQLWCWSHNVAVVRLHRHRRQHGWTCPQPARVVVFPFSRLGSCHFCDSVGRVLPVLLFIASSRTTVAFSVCSELPVCDQFGD